LKIFGGGSDLHITHRKVFVLSGEAFWVQRIKEILSDRQRKTISRGSLIPSAVLVPVYENGGECHIVLTRRSDDVVHHKGQVSFPGGAYDNDDGDLSNTALRETFEEIGVCMEDVEILGKLDDQSTSSGFAITPFVGAIPYPYEFTINRREVDALIEAPVSALLNPANFSPQTPDYGGRLHPWAYYRYEGYQITGITALILQQYLELAFT
jgi:8-oxo-dGTP pyrophosphatase MutT (NUDIX family)